MVRFYKPSGRSSPRRAAPRTGLRRGQAGTGRNAPFVPTESPPHTWAAPVTRRDTRHAQAAEGAASSSSAAVPAVI
ncbi:hypothetical protein GCM10009678_51170 [Actinomadura kijaniata]